MIVLDAARCAYCGGCISVCPVAALTLAETRRTISADCYEDDWQATVGRKMQRNYRLRGRFSAEQRCDERFVQAFVLSVK